MSQITDEIATFVALSKRFGARRHVRVLLSTEEAMGVARLLPSRVLRRADATLRAVRAFEVLLETEAPKDRAALKAHLEWMERVENEFWFAFSGQVFAGGTIERRFA